jgi:cyclase
VQVTDEVLAWVQPDGSWWINNAGVVLGGEGPVLIDTCATEARARRFLTAVGAALGSMCEAARGTAREFGRLYRTYG